VERIKEKMKRSGPGPGGYISKMLSVNKSSVRAAKIGTAKRYDFLTKNT